MPENLNKKVTIRFEGDTTDLVKDTELAIKQLEKVGVAAKKVTQSTVPGKPGRARTTVQAAGIGSSADVHRKTAAALKQVEAQTKSTLGVVRNYSVTYDKAVNSTKTFTSATNRANTALKDINKTHRLTVRHVLKYSGAYAAATAAMGSFIAAAASIPKIGMELQATTAVMSASFGGLEGANTQLAFISKLADDAKVSIGELQASYRKFSASTKLVGLATEETQLIFSNFTKVSRALHLSTADTESTFRALTQIFNKNKIMAEELQNQLGERIPGAVAAFAESMGKTTEELNKMMEKGLVKPQFLIAQFSEFLKNKFATAYEQSLNNLQAKLAEAGNAWTRFAQEAFIATEKGMVKLTEFATAVIEFARDHLPELGLAIKAITALLVGRFYSSIINIVRQTWAWVGANLALIKSYRGVNAAAAQTTFASSLGSIKGLGKVTAGAATKITLFNKALGKIPHPGAKLAAIGLTIATFALDINKASEATITYGDTTVRVTSLIEASWNNLKTTVSQIVGELTELYNNYAKGVVDNLASTASATFEKLKRGAYSLGDSFRTATEYIPGVTALWGKAEEVADGVTSALFAQAKALDEVKDKAKENAAILAKAQKESTALQEQMHNARILREAKAKKAKEELATASAKAKEASDKLLKSYLAEVTALELQLIKLRKGEEAYIRAKAASEGYNKTQQDNLVLLNREVKAEEKAKEVREKKIKAWEKGKEKLKELNSELYRAQQLTKLLTSGDDKIDVVNADKLVAANEEIGKLPVGLQVAAQQTAQLLAEQNAYNDRLKKGFDLISGLKENLAGLADPATAFELKLSTIAPEQQSEALKLYYETQLQDLENSLKTEEERIEESYKRRTELILFNTEDGSKRQNELLNRLEQENLNRKAEAQRKERELMLQGYSSVLSGLNTLAEATAGKSSASQKRLLAVQKGIAIAQATIDTIAAAVKAMNDPNPNPVAKFANYAAVFAQGMSAVAAIRSVNVDAGAFATGGSFTVPGTGGTDSKVVQLRATPGERVTVETPQQQKTNSPTTFETKINIINNTSSNVTAKSQRNADGSETVTIVVADLENDGPISRNLQQRFGLQRSAV